MGELLHTWIFCFSILVGFQILLSFMRLFVKKRETRDKKDLHFFRRFHHVMSGIILVYLSKTVNNINYSRLFTFFALLILTTIDVTRRYFDNVSKWVQNTFMVILRKEETIDKKPITSIFFILGSFFSFCFFEHEIARLAILFLSFGDPMASIVGIKYGKHKIYGEKSLQGNIVCGLTCGLINLLYLNYLSTEINLIYLNNFNKFFVGFIAGSISELVPSKFFYDDNASIPVYAGFMLTLVNNMVNK